jgi:BON domain
MNNDSALTQERAITEHVRQVFRANTTTARYPIEVAVQGATVSLHGTVDSQETKDTAEQLARSVPSVVNVINGLVIDQDVDKGAGWLGLGRDREGAVAVPPIVGAAGLAGTGTGGAVFPAVPLAGAMENLAPEEGEKPDS